MDKFLKELEVGEIHLRDNWQFELKSEFLPLPHVRTNEYTQEFYLFIPNSFQINGETYTKEEFYRDQTNFIRYKTPKFTLKQLIDPRYKHSPFSRIAEAQEGQLTVEVRRLMEEELKLLGNIIRSALREEVSELMGKMDQEAILAFTEDLRHVREHYANMQDTALGLWDDKGIASHFEYIDEFISISINQNLVGLLQHLRKDPATAKLEAADTALAAFLIAEKRHRESHHQEPKKIDEEQEQNEYTFYRGSLLSKFVLDALLLDINRASVGKRFRNLIGGISAGVAMLIYLMLWVWQGTVFAINSAPFILITVILYILKDRLKESLRTVSFRQASRWFPDYTTKLCSPSKKEALGEIAESFSFISEKSVPTEISSIRNREFHAVFERFKRPERVIYYKRQVTIEQPRKGRDPRRHALNIIFRFNIHHFLAKLANPYHRYITIDPESHAFVKTRLPKVYHLNIIMKNTYLNEDKSTRSELKKFRLVIDKTGLKRVEQIH